MPPKKPKQQQGTPRKRQAPNRAVISMGRAGKVAQPRVDSKACTENVTNVAYGKCNVILHSALIAIDECCPGDFAKCFTQTGICEILLTSTKVVGSVALENLCGGLSSTFKGVRHWEGNVCLREHDGHLINVSYWKALRGGDIISTGIHVDRFADHGGSAIAHRIIAHTFAGGKTVDAPPISTMIRQVTVL
eukprot:m.103328 g.103328  ORF g.103328 m.103328 type:complete len:191 (+) comp27493_c0_seq1:76-648(+)